MKTIQIPSPSKGGGGDHCVRIPFHCRVSFQFHEAGLFSRSPDGGDFSPTLPDGFITPGQVYTSAAPDYPVEVDWRFAPLNIAHPVIDGTIQVAADGSCSDTLGSTPCRDRKTVKPL